MAAKQEEEDQSLIDQQEAIIDQVRIEMETYFAPANIENDYNLKRKMTTDGYIDIDLLLGLKLIQDLASDRDILIEAISRSKSLVMNTARTMVKYMPLLERNVLILRDIASSTEKSKILEIFNNAECAKVVSVRSDIGDNWFVTFKTEEECLKTFTYLQPNGSFNGEKLKLRVKAVHDTNSADASPQSKKVRQPPTIEPFVQVPPPDIVPPIYGQQGPYNEFTYYSGEVAPYFISYNRPPVVQQPPPMDDLRQSAKKTNKNESASKNKDDINNDLEQENAQNDNVEEKTEEFTAYSDYPGSFDKYTQQEFLDIYHKICATTITAPMSMRGRDSRIIQEEVQRPAVIIQIEEEKLEKEQKEREKKDGKGNKKSKNKKKKNKRKKSMDEMQRGTFHVDDYGRPYYEQQDYEYWNDAYMAGQSYYYSGNNTDYGGRTRRTNQGSYGGGYSNGYYNEEQYYDAAYYNQGYSGGYRNDYAQSYNQGKSQKRSNGGNGGGGNGGGARKYNSKRNNNNQRSRNKWSPRSGKKYATNRGVYRSKQQTAY